jgi:molecular chaperone GrpE
MSSTKNDNVTNQESGEEINIPIEQDESNGGTKTEEAAEKHVEEPKMSDNKSELEKTQEELAKVKDQLLRQVAEFDNFRRRTREEQSRLVKYGNEQLILELLPVLDDYERSLDAGRTHHDFDAFFAGIEILRNKFYATLERYGLKPVDTKDQAFNEEFHEALLQVPNSGKDPGTIIDEAERGYKLFDKVIRHSKVTVAAE